MSATISLDLLREIKVDHDNIRYLKDSFDAAAKDTDDKLMGRIAATMVREAAIHSDSEEMSVYKALDAHDLHAVAEHDRKEHQEVKQAFAKVDRMLMLGADIDELRQAVTEASSLFLHHAKDEEETQLPKLMEKISKGDMVELTKNFLGDRKKVPERPHPLAPQHGGITQAVAGMAAKPIDALVQAWREHVPLKYHHAEL
ncbi:hypothetical protein OC861_006621 [Tilletia horrida]|nr:hypothetical protein OC861_006621 [Tilletia horrida]